MNFLFLYQTCDKLIPELTAKVTKDNLNAMIRTIKVLKRIKIEDFLRLLYPFFIYSHQL
jgi:hypothetical protein